MEFVFVVPRGDLFPDCYPHGLVPFGEEYTLEQFERAVVEHGFCEPEECNEFFQLENLTAPGGKMPLNTSGGNLAECYMHGLGLNIEAVRQIRGDSTSQVADANVSMVISGPMVTPVSSSIFGSEATL